MSVWCSNNCVLLVSLSAMSETVIILVGTSRLIVWYELVPEYRQKLYSIKFYVAFPDMYDYGWKNANGAKKKEMTGSIFIWLLFNIEILSQ